MRYVYISEELNEDVLSNFLDKINEFNGEEFTLYLDTPGGFVNVANSMVDLINHYPSEVTIAASHLGSCGYHLFMVSNSKKRLIDGCTAIIHNMFFQTDTNTIVSGEGFYFDHVRDIKKINLRYQNMLREIGVSEESIIELNQGKDVRISYEDLTLQTKRAENKYYKSKEVA